MTTADIRPLYDAQQEWRRAYLQAAWDAHRGNSSATARALGIQRTYFLRLRKRFDIQRPRKVCEG